MNHTLLLKMLKTFMNNSKGMVATDKSLHLSILSIHNPIKVCPRLILGSKLKSEKHWFTSNFQEDRIKNSAKQQ